MRTVFFCLALCVTCLTAPLPAVEGAVPLSPFHPQNRLRPQVRDNPNRDYLGKSAGSLAEFVTPEVPINPFTMSHNTWETEIGTWVVSPGQTESGITDVHSGASGVSPTDGTPYKPW